MLELIAFLQVFLRAIDAGGKVIKELGCDIGGLDGMNFEDLAEFIEVADLLGGELANVGSAPGLDTYEAFGFETIERFAYGRFADSKLRGEGFLGETG
jgi:hypothetical protein